MSCLLIYGRPGIPAKADPLINPYSKRIEIIIVYLAAGMI